ncbi:MAG: hypothetical protein JXB39_05740 [Deltaproteobacteria bacterium]|nr:hypothetical protein [Deltaproteobacteria bacterium]
MWKVLLLLAACSTLPADDTGPATDDTGSGDVYGAVTATGGDCKGEAFAVDPTPVVWAEVEGRDILLHLDDLTANCCPTPGAEITLAGGTFSVVFDDLAGGGGCFCECVIDFVVRIADVASGTWTLDVAYRGADLGSTEVSVP